MAKGVVIDGAGAALARLRRDAGFNTVDQAADAFGVDRSLIYKYEGNAVGVPESYLEKLAARLDRSLTYVVLECMKERYPDLGKKSVAGFFKALLKEIE
jgi:transcriptional regulator with XRE-family HTH domain